MSPSMLEADRLARQRAVRCFDRHMILEAGAGTGKTTVLVDRVIAWCLGPGYEAAIDPAASGCDGAGVNEQVGARVFERLAALTFSEAAAAEMETRIAGALREIVRGGRRANSLGAGVSEASAIERAGSLLDHCERLQVTTIHSFCRRLLVAYPLEAGVAPGFHIDASGRASGRAARTVVERLLTNPSAAEVDDLGALTARGCGPAELERLLCSLLLGPIQADAFAVDPLAPAAIGAFWERLRDAAQSLAVEGFGEAADQTLRLFEDLDPASPEGLDIALAQLHDDWPPALLRRVDRLPAVAPAAALLRHAQSFDATSLRRLHRLLAPRLLEAAAALQSEGALGFDDLLCRTRDLLQSHPGVADRVRRSLSQLLIDEFQDTDQVQCEIVASLALANAGPTLFVVGDPKQSIYAWRSADLRAYDHFLARLDGAGALRHRLSVSHRSLPVILDEVERCMAPVMVREAGVQPEFQPLVASDAQRTRNVGGSVGVEYWVAQAVDDAGCATPTSSADSLALETRALVEDLHRVHREGRVPWNEFAVLLRSTGELDRYLEALRRADIPYAVDRDRVYFRRREVLEARALLRLLLDPNDDLAWVATLRSARCGVPDAAWTPLFREGLIDLARRAFADEPFAPRALSEALDRVARDLEGLALPGLDALAGWKHALLDGIDTLVALRRSFENDPFELFLARTRRLALLDISEGARFLGRYRVANLERFFRETANLYAASGGDLAVVKRELRRADLPLPEGEESRPPGVGTDAVQVMTIHGAKGLDFEYVYLLQAHKGSAIRSDGSVNAELLDGEVEYALRWGRRGDAAVVTAGWDRVELRRAAAAEAEQVRTLYVAMTRAKTRLVVSGRLAEGRVGARRSHADCLAQRLENGLPAGVRRRLLGAERHTEEASRGAPHPARPKDPDTRARPPLGPARRDLAWAHAAHPYTQAASAAVSLAVQAYEGAAALAESATPEIAGNRFGSASGHGAAIGTAIHAFLETYDFEDEEAWPAALATLRARLVNRVPADQRAAAEKTALDVLESMRAGPLWVRLRALQGHVLGREVPLLARPQLDSIGSPPGRQPGAPVAAYIGAIDLLYRDPETGQVVVVDFKSDRVTDEPGLRARAAHYQPQGRVYCEAVADALGLGAPIRFELWFLAMGQCVATQFELPVTEARPAHNHRGDHPPLG